MSLFACQPNPLTRPRTWNRRAVQVGAAGNQDAGAAWYGYANASRWESTPTGLEGKLALPYNTFGEVAIYNAADATTTIETYYTLYDISTDYGHGEEIPWNPAWVPSGASDAFILVDLTDQGERGDGIEAWYVTDTDPSLQAGTVVARTQANVGTQLSRGAGAIPKRAGILVGSEIVTALAGDEVVPHALSIVSSNHNAGAWADANDAFVAPCTRIEHPEGAPTNPPNQIIVDAPDSRLIPEGSRFALAITASDIEDWLDARSLTGALRDTARVIAKTLSFDLGYGFMSVESGVGQPLIECDVVHSSSVWNTTLGVDSFVKANTLLDDLITDTNIVVLNPESAHP